MNTKPANHRKLSLALSAALAGGSLLTTCEARLKDAVVGGTKDFISTLLDPSTYIELIELSDNGTTDGT